MVHLKSEKCSDFGCEFFRSVDGAIVPSRLLDLFNGGSIFRVQGDHSIEQILKVLAEEGVVLLLDLAVLAPELVVLSVEEASEIDSTDSVVLSMGKHASGQEGEEDDTSRVDVSSLGVLASSLDDLRGSVELGSSAQDLGVIGKVRKIEIGNLEGVVGTDQQVFKLEIHVGNASGVEVFQTFDQLSEIGSHQFIVDVLAVVHDEIKEVTIGGEFHDGVGNLLAGSLGDGLSFVFNMMSSDNIGVVDKRETGFVLEISVGLVVSIREHLHGVVLLGGLGVNQVNGEFSLVQSFNDSDVTESFGIFSADHSLSLHLRFVERRE